jgi:type II secretory pathway pseudopilin PulG
MRRYQQAFMIIEWVIVIGIILFLAKQLIPRYTNISYKARQTEVALNLSALYALQQEYLIEHGHYATGTALTWKPRGYNRANPDHSYTYGVQGGSEGTTLFTGSSKTAASLLPRTHLTPQNFCVGAAVVAGSTIDRWSIDETGALTHLPEERKE